MVDEIRSPGKGSLLVIFLTVFVDLLGFGIVLPLLPIYAEQYGAAGWQIGVLMASFSAMQFVFSPIWGRLSDQIGRRPVAPSCRWRTVQSLRWRWRASSRRPLTAAAFAR